MTKSKAAITILTVTFAYAVLRYNIARGTSWEHLPLFITNKAVALASVISICASYSLGSLTRFLPQIFTPLLTLRKFLGIFGFGLASLHALISLLIMNEGYYERFFASSGQLTLTGELSMLFGILSFFVFLTVAVTSMPNIAESLEKKDWLMIQKLGYLGLITVFLHVLTMGYSGWLKTETWPAKLLPISLIAAIFIMSTIFLKLISLSLPVKTPKQ